MAIPKRLLIWVGVLVFAISLLHLYNELNDRVFGVKIRLERLETKLWDTQVKLKSLESHNKFTTERIGSLEDTEIRREFAVCRAFPSAKDCKELTDLMAGSVVRQAAH